MKIDASLKLKIFSQMRSSAEAGSPASSDHKKTKSIVVKGAEKRHCVALDTHTHAQKCALRYKYIYI